MRIDVIEDVLYIEDNGLQFEPYFFKKGGHEVVVPKTREKKIAEDKWVASGSYFTSLKSCLDYAARQMIFVKYKEHAITLEKYLAEYDQLVGELYKVTENVKRGGL